MGVGRCLSTFASSNHRCIFVERNEEVLPPSPLSPLELSSTLHTCSRPPSHTRRAAEFRPHRLPLCPGSDCPAARPLASREDAALTYRSFRFKFAQHSPTTRPSRRKDCRESIYAFGSRGEVPARGPGACLTTWVGRKGGAVFLKYNLRGDSTQDSVNPQAQN